MWRNETKADREAKEAKLLKKQQEEWNRNHAKKVPQKTLQEILHPNRAAEEYRKTQELKIAEEGFRKREAEQKEKEEQDFIKKIASVQDDKEAFTPAELYDAGIEARKEGDGVEATMRLWQALICGDKRAAYPLFEILRDGEAGIPQNMEMAGLFFYVASRCGDEKCKTTRIPENMPFDAATAVLEIEIKSRGYIVNQNRKITDKILFEIQDQADEVLDDFNLKTRAKHQPMRDVFVHPHLVAEKGIDEVPLAGEDQADQGCFCIIC